MVARGEIWWLEEPDARRRPYLILTRDEGVSVLNQLLAVPATRTIRDIPTEVLLGSSDGMPVECVLSLDNLRLVRKSRLTRRITTVSDSKLREVCEALGFATAC
ncbi:MAG: type II toxin-antitoxin system PemK/MazF family toxin [Actinobacteria bacterium]|nr:type II toxin-antitoxin system PemK/MazF family toxin [Actinomycetota bacterium]